jgi:hypothetical protein
MSQADDEDSIEKRSARGDNMKPTERGASKDDAEAIRPNPPRTTTGRWFVAPKFGSAGSGGLELEPGPERD